MAEVCHIILKRLHVGKTTDGRASALAVPSSDSEGYTPLHMAITNGHIAARSGREEYVKMLIESHGLYELDLNLPETGYGWTPLIVACVQDNQLVVGTLLDAGADENLCDVFGWTARDHTAFRGFWLVGKLLAATPPESSARIPKIQLQETNTLPPSNTNETRIFVNLGTLDTREPKPAVDINPYLAIFLYNPYPEIGFSVKISAVGATGSTGPIQLSILNDAINYPHVFTTTNLDKVQLVLSVFKANIDIQEGEHIGGAVALLAELKSRLGPDSESLIRNYTIPVLDRHRKAPFNCI